jgi:RNA polymerase sigma factor (sigma-70 family)
MTSVQQQLVLQYVPLANKLAYQKKRTLPNFIDIEELKSAAYLGLVEAASRYNPDFGVAFSTFAYPRVFGAIYDYLRDLGHSVRCVSLDVPSTEDEACDLKDTIASPVERNNSEFLEVVGVDLDGQAEQILRLYFIEEYSMKEVGLRLGVTESRISQLIKRYKQHIRDRWEKCDLFAMLAA